MHPLILLAAVTVCAPAPLGLGGLKPLTPLDPKVAAVEMQILDAINAERAKHHTEPVVMDERLRAFARHQAEMAAVGDPQAQHTEDAISAQNLGSVGHRSQYSFGAEGAAVLQNVMKDADAQVFLTGDFMRAGIGAFYVPENPPYFQTMLLFVADPDPMLGKPGLNPNQTDPVMLDAGADLQACYNAALHKNPNLQGDVMLSTVIGEGGKVQSVTVPKSLGDLSLDGCLQKVTRALQFPAPYKGRPVTLNHPMRFTRPQSDRKLGKLRGEQIQKVFLAAAPDWRACFVARQKVNPKLRGTLTLTAVIGGDGTMKSVDAVEDEPNDLALRVCVLGRAAKLVFPAPEFGGEVDLTYPLRFGF